MSEAYDLPAGRARAASLRDLAAIQRDGDNLTAAARALDEALDEITRLRAEQVGTPHPPALRPCDAHLVDRIRRAVTGPYAGPAAGLAVITPGGARAADGDLSTAWHGTAGRSLVFDLPNGAQAKALFLMGACPDKSGSRVLSVRVSGTSPAGAFSASRDLAANTLYFERVDLGVAASGRLTVEISKTSGPDPACVPEIRLGD